MFSFHHSFIGAGLVLDILVNPENPGLRNHHSYNESSAALSEAGIADQAVPEENENRIEKITNKANFPKKKKK
jgi:hypothetical protein